MHSNKVTLSLNTLYTKGEIGTEKAPLAICRKL